MAEKYLNQQGLTTLVNSLASVCASNEDLNALDNDTRMYLLDIDYNADLLFDTNEIVTIEEN